MFKKRDQKYYGGGLGTVGGSSREMSIESTETARVRADVRQAGPAPSVLLRTIKIPKNLNMLTNRLPKATYGENFDSTGLESQFTKSTDVVDRSRSSAKKGILYYSQLDESQSAQPPKVAPVSNMHAISTRPSERGRDKQSLQHQHSNGALVN